MMKKKLAIIVFTLALLMALAAPAFAMKQKMYVKKDCYPGIGQGERAHAP